MGGVLFNKSSPVDKGDPAKAIETARANFFLSNEEGIKDSEHEINKYDTPGNRIINMQH